MQTSENRRNGTDVEEKRVVVETTSHSPIFGLSLPLNSPIFGLSIALIYGVISISITFFNKAVLSVYDFNFSNTLVLGQMVVALILLVTMKKGGFVQYPNFSWKTARVMLPLMLWFSGMVITGLAGLRFVNVPIYNTLRRLTTFIVIAGEFLYLKKTIPFAEFFGVILMVGGAFVAGWGDLSFSLSGYIITTLNCVVTAGYLVCIRYTKNRHETTEFEMMFYNNVLSIPFVALLVILLEWKDLVHYPNFASFGFQVSFLMSALQAFLLNLFIFLCSTFNSPLTTSVTGQVKAIASTIIGLWIFGDVIITSLLLIGLFISSAGSVYYAYVKYRQGQARKQQAEQQQQQEQEHPDREPSPPSTQIEVNETEKASTV